MRIRNWQRVTGPAAAEMLQTTDDPTRIGLLPEPENPNGSIANIAGLCDTTGRVLGLMPHPERFLFATQHPQWTRLGLRGEGDGIKVFRNAVAVFWLESEQFGPCNPALGNRSLAVNCLKPPA